MVEDPNLNNVDRVEETKVTETPGYEHRETVVDEIGEAQARTANRVTQFLWLILGIIEIILGLRFLLHLIGANPSAPFASWIYNLSQVFLWPFSGLVGTPAAGGIVFDFTTLIAMLVYWLVFWVIVKLVWLILYPNRARRVTSYRERIEK